MMRVASNSVLVVPPFECAWLSGEELKFPQPGRGCATFEARADNDVTVIFKEDTGSRHYRADTGRSYTVVLGSHRNKRLRIEVDGYSVADVPGTAVSKSEFRRYWIDVNNGVITVGKGEPGQGILYQWKDSQPNFGVQYVGLSSWDKYVGYRGIRVLPAINFAGASAGGSSGASLQHFLNWKELSDLHFSVGPTAEVVYAHRVLLASSCTAFCEHTEGRYAGACIQLPDVEYHVLMMLLHYAYIGRVQAPTSKLAQLRALAIDFGLQSLVALCDSRLAVAVSSSQEAWVDLVFKECTSRASTSCLAELPVDLSRLLTFFEEGRYCDITLAVESEGVVMRAHRIVLSAWSAPFCKMFTNGMQESAQSTVTISGTSGQALLAMVRYLYKGQLDLREDEEGQVLLPLFMFADRFQVQELVQICSDRLLECLSEESMCSILQVASTLPNCAALRDACEELCAKNMDYLLVPPASDLRDLDALSLDRILKHPELWVTSEEKVLDAVILWGSNCSEVKGWEDAHSLLEKSSASALFMERLPEMMNLLRLIHFPVMPAHILRKLQASQLAAALPALQALISEAMEYQGLDHEDSAEQRRQCQPIDVDLHGRKVKLQQGHSRFKRRLSAYKELLYINDGDQNGVCYYVGTNYGAEPWMNPVLTKRLSVSSSSPPSRYCDPKALVSGYYQNTCFAGPRLEIGQLRTWWKIDLGEGHQLLCNYYTIRQDGSSNYMRSWGLQGSMDGEQWTDLRVHKNDPTLCNPGQYASWPVSGQQAYLPCRMFRVLLTDQTTSRSNPWHLCICYLELYGYFR